MAAPWRWYSPVANVSPMPHESPVMALATAPLPTLFLSQVGYDLARLMIVLADGASEAFLNVAFDQPKAFRTYAESDYWHYLNEFAGRALVDFADGGCGIELSADAPYLLDYRANARPQEAENTFSCLIRTPDHCVEVICFEEPEIGRY